MTIKSKQARLSIVLSPPTAPPSPEKTNVKCRSVIRTRAKSSPLHRQSNPQDQALVEQLKPEAPHQIQQTKDHLKLIDSFDILINLSHQAIFSLNSPSQNNPTQQPDHPSHSADLEDSFYHLALFRFELWLGRIADHLPQSLYIFKSQARNDFGKDDYEIELTLDYLPPLDVLFVWYSYCLNSRNYFEDSLRLYPILKYLRFPLELAASEYDFSCQSTNNEKLKRNVKKETPEEVEALLKILKTSEITSESATKFQAGDLKNVKLLSALLLPKNFHSESGSNSRKFWVKLTNTHFNIVDFIDQPSFRTFICPLCNDTIESPFYVRDPETQLVQVSNSCWSYSLDRRSSAQDGKHATIDQKPNGANHKNHAILRCHNCSWMGIKQDLSLFKFATELKFCFSNLTVQPKNSKRASDPIDCLAGTLTTTNDLNDVRNAIFFNNLFLQDQNHVIFKNFNERDPSEILSDCLNYLKIVQNAIKFTMCSDSVVPFDQKSKIEKSFNNLLKAYCVPEPFSVDLIRSMKIQRNFIKKMVKLGWTQIQNPKKESMNIPQEEIDYRLQSCVSRYKAFSNLVSTIQPHLLLIPTTDIDLAWKTDRLRGVLYTESMMRDNKLMVDHPDEFDFDRSKFLDQFRLTSALWVHRYQIEYSRYPAPFVKSKRRQNWLKKALAQAASSPTQPNPWEEYQSRTDRVKETDHNQVESVQSPIQNVLPAGDVHLRPDAQPKLRSRPTSIGIDITNLKKAFHDVNHEMSMPVKLDELHSHFEQSESGNIIESRRLSNFSSNESAVDPITTAENQLLEHNTATIAIASYVQNIYTSEEPLIKSTTLPIKLTPLRHNKETVSIGNGREQQQSHKGKEVAQEHKGKEAAQEHKGKEAAQEHKGKEVAQDSAESSSSSVVTLYSRSALTASPPMFENTIGRGSTAEASKTDAVTFYEARKLSVKFVEDAKQTDRINLNCQTERSNVEAKHQLVSPVNPPPFFQSAVPSIRKFPLDSPVAHGQNQVQSRLPIAEIVAKNLIHQSERTPSRFKGIENPNKVEMGNHHLERRLETNPAANSSSQPADQLNHNDQSKLANSKSSHNQFGGEKTDSACVRETTDERNRQAHVQSPGRIKHQKSVSHDESESNSAFFQIPIGRIVFVEDGNKFRCL